MAEQKYSTIVELKVDTQAAAQKALELDRALKDLKKTEKDLRKEIEKEGQATAEQKEQLAKITMEQHQLNEQKKAYQKEVKNNLKILNSQEGSLKQQRAILAKLNEEWDSLSETARKGEYGEKLKAQIDELNESVKEAEQSTGRFQRSVGDYEGSIKRALGGMIPFGDSIVDLADSSEAAGKGFKGFGAAIKSAAKSALAFLMTPIGAALASIAATLALVNLRSEQYNKALEGSEELQKKATWATAAATVWQEKFKKVREDWFKMELANSDKLRTGWGAVGDLFKKLIGTGNQGDSFEGIFARIFFGDDVAKQQEREKASLALLQQARDLTIEEAKVAKDVAKLRADAKDKEHYTDEQRLSFVRQANDLELKLAEKKKQYAEEALNIAKGNTELSDTSTEDLDKIAQLEADKYIAETEYQMKRKELLENEQSILNEIRAEKQAAFMETMAQKEAEVEAMNAVIDLEIKLMADGFEKERRMAEENTRRTIEALKKRLDTEKNLTTKAREAINKQILLQEQALQQQLNSFDRQAFMEQLDARAREIEWSLKLAEKGTMEELSIKLEKLKTEREITLANDQLTAKERVLIEQWYTKEMDRLISEQMKTKEAQAKQDYALHEASADLLGSMSQLLEEAGDKNKALAVAAKALALGEIAINTGLAISKGISASAGVPFPGNIAAIASTVATVMANVASAIGMVKSAKFATGGYVSGDGSATSDSVPARLSNGESVSNASATSMFWPLQSALNLAGGGAPIIPNGASPASMRAGEDMLARSFARGAQSVQLSVSVAEINAVQDRVAYLETLGDVK